MAEIGSVGDNRGLPRIMTVSPVMPAPFSSLDNNLPHGFAMAFWYVWQMTPRERIPCCIAQSRGAGQRGGVFVSPQAAKQRFKHICRVESGMFFR